MSAQLFPRGPHALLPLITLGGSMPEVETGATSEIGMLFPEGDYIVIDPEVKGPPPLGFFEVSAATGPEVNEPAADHSVEAGDYSHWCVACGRCGYSRRLTADDGLFHTALSCNLH